MFLGLEWYWWIVIIAAAGISILFKIRFVNWWDKRRRERKDGGHGKWGDEE